MPAVPAVAALATNRPWIDMQAHVSNSNSPTKREAGFGAAGARTSFTGDRSENHDDALLDGRGYRLLRTFESKVADHTSITRSAALAS